MRSILIIAAHPDDEILGCGGAIAKHALNGDEVHIAIMAEGLTSRSEERDREKYEEEMKKLHANSLKAAQILGAVDVKFFDFPDNRMDSVDLLDVVKKVELMLDEYQPDIVYTHYQNDLNVDHQITSKAVITACRPIGDNCVKRILFFEVLSSTEWQIANDFQPNWFIDVEDVFAKKIDALHCYDSEMREYPHSRSYKMVEILAGYRGAASGCKLAEAFILGRYIDR